MKTTSHVSQLLLRFAHAIGLAYWIVLAAGSLVSLAIGRLHGRPIHIVMYSGMLVVLLFIADCASWHFHSCSFRTALGSYLLWLVMFVWYGFFGPVAPYIRGPDSWPGRWDYWALKATEFAFFLASFAILPVLRYSAENVPHVTPRTA
jgi:hypothetical protein